MAADDLELFWVPQTFAIDGTPHRQPPVEEWLADQDLLSLDRLPQVWHLFTLNMMRLQGQGDEIHQQDHLNEWIEALQTLYFREHRRVNAKWRRDHPAAIQETEARSCMAHASFPHLLGSSHLVRRAGVFNVGKARENWPLSRVYVSFW